MSDWKKYTEVEWNNPNYNKFHIDTRDFHCSMDLDPEPHDDYQTLSKNKERFFFTEDELKSEIDRLYNESGGEGNWRMLYLESEDSRVIGWKLKYIRIFRTDLGFIVCNSYNKAIPKDILSSKVGQEHLNHH